MYFISVNSKTSQYSSIISVRIRLFLLLRLYMCSCTEAAGAVNVRLNSGIIVSVRDTRIWPQVTEQIIHALDELI